MFLLTPGASCVVIFMEVGGMLDKQKKSAYDQQYQKTHMKSLAVWFNREKDADILAFLETAKSKTQLVKDCIRKQMENSGRE